MRVCPADDETHKAAVAILQSVSKLKAFPSECSA